MTDLGNDTIDIKDEVDDIDEILAAGSVTVAAQGRHTGLVELALVVIANLIWAVVGLILWLPQVMRAILWTALKTIHSALTGQSSGRAVAGIKEVSRSYAERFLHRQNEQAWVGRRHELRPFRLVAEAAWAILFYLLLLRWWAPERFGPVWRVLVESSSSTRSSITGVAARLKELLVPDPATFDGVGLKAAGVVFIALFVGAALGFWLGRRSR